MKVSANIGFGFMGKAIVQKTENSKSSGSKRRLRIAAALVLVVAGICGGSLWWHRNAVQEHDQAFAPYTGQRSKSIRLRRANTTNT